MDKSDCDPCEEWKKEFATHLEAWKNDYKSPIASDNEDTDLYGEWKKEFDANLAEGEDVYRSPVASDIEEYIPFSPPRLVRGYTLDELPEDAEVWEPFIGSDKWREEFEVNLDAWRTMFVPQKSGAEAEVKKTDE